MAGKLAVLTIVFIVSLTFTIALAQPEDPDNTCKVCAINANCQTYQCSCLNGGDPYFNCQTNGSDYCSLIDNTLSTFGLETVDVLLISETLLAEVTVNRNAPNNGVCQFNMTATFDRVNSKTYVNEIQFTLRQVDFLGIYTAVGVKIVSYVSSETYFSEIYFRPANAQNFTLAKVLDSTADDRGGQFTSYTCFISYNLPSDDLVRVTIPCCGLELGFRPYNLYMPKRESGVYLSVARANNPRYDFASHQPLCLGNSTNYNINYVQNLTGLSDPTQAMNYLGLTNVGTSTVGQKLMETKNQNDLERFFKIQEFLFQKTSYQESPCMQNEDALLSYILDTITSGTYANLRKAKRKLAKECSLSRSDLKNFENFFF